MLGIKKVQVVPLDENYAKIINSTSTADDKTKNAYSMKIVDDKMDAKSDIGHNHDDRYPLKDDFVVLTGTVTLYPDKQIYLELDYPTGFNQSNTFIISNMVDLQSGGYINGWIAGISANDPSYIDNYIVGNTQPRIKLLSDSIELYFFNGSTVNNVTYDYKILLMKIKPEFYPSV